MDTKVIGRGRKFLSSIFHEGGSVCWEVTQDTWQSDSKKRKDIGGFLTIRDCSRSITLEFNVMTEKERKQRLKKLDTLVSELVKMRECLVKGEVKNGG